MKKWILLSGLLGVLAASQAIGSAADKPDPKPKCPPTTHCPCGH